MALSSTSGVNNVARTTVKPNFGRTRVHWAFSVRPVEMDTKFPGGGQIERVEAFLVVLLAVMTKVVQNLFLEHNGAHCIVPVLVLS